MFSVYIQHFYQGKNAPAEHWSLNTQNFPKINIDISFDLNSEYSLHIDSFLNPQHTHTHTFFPPLLYTFHTELKELFGFLCFHRRHDINVGSCDSDRLSFGYDE